MSIADSINAFCAYFDDQVAAIGRLTVAPASGRTDSGAGSEFRYRKILYVTAIDALAGLRYHKLAYPQLSRQNRERFTRFVKEHAAWPQGELVSLTPVMGNPLDHCSVVRSAPLMIRPASRADRNTRGDGYDRGCRER
jgi:hypothetical protein